MNHLSPTPYGCITWLICNGNWPQDPPPPPLYETCPIIYCKQEMWSDCRVKGVGSKGQIPQPLVCLADQTQRASMNAHTHVQEHTAVYECNRLDELIEPASPKGQQQHFFIFFIPEFGDFLPCSLVIVYIFQHCSHWFQLYCVKDTWALPVFPSVMCVFIHGGYFMTYSV